MSAFGGPNIITDGLVLSLDAGNVKSYPGSGTTWYDKSGNGNNGTLTNGPTFSNGSIVFDGVDDYVATTSFNINYITIHSWVKFNNFTNYNEVVGKWRISDNNYSFTLLSNINDGAVRFWVNTDSNIPIVNNGGTILTGVWNHISATFNGTTSSIYLNGSFIQSVPVTGTLKNSDVVVNIGSRLGHIYPMNGNIANTQIYNRALTASEVLQNYNATKSRFGL